MKIIFDILPQSYYINAGRTKDKQVSLYRQDMKTMKMK